MHTVPLFPAHHPFQIEITLFVAEPQGKAISLPCLDAYDTLRGEQGDKKRIGIAPANTKTGPLTLLAVPVFTPGPTAVTCITNAARSPVLRLISDQPSRTGVRRGYAKEVRASEANSNEI